MPRYEKHGTYSLVNLAADAMLRIRLQKIALEQSTFCTAETFYWESGISARAGAHLT
jgi:hypothetical protein